MTLVERLSELPEDLESWAAYADDYFKQKHDLAGCIARAKATASEAISLIEAQQAELASLRGMVPVWQPIETAPKDGTSILVYPPTWAKKTASIASWNEDKYAKSPRPFWNRDDDMGKVLYSRNKPPTHWMPLPPAPGEGGKENG